MHASPSTGVSLRNGWPQGGANARPTPPRPFTCLTPTASPRHAYAAGMAAERVDVRTAQQMQRAGDTIIDVRTSDEYAAGHIAGAINIPIDTLTLARLPPGQLLTTCSLGGRGGRAADLLDRAGRAVLSIEGGTKAWAAAGLPMETGLHRRTATTTYRRRLSMFRRYRLRRST
jgi:rhodanese-related sulfurtransferase